MNVEDYLSYIYEEQGILYAFSNILAFLIVFIPFLFLLYKIHQKLRPQIKGKSDALLFYSVSFLAIFFYLGFSSAFLLYIDTPLSNHFAACLYAVSITLTFFFPIFLLLTIAILAYQLFRKKKKEEP